MSIPAYLVPNGGFITTKSNIFGRQFIVRMSAFTRSKDAP